MWSEEININGLPVAVVLGRNIKPGKTDSDLSKYEIEYIFFKQKQDGKPDIPQKFQVMHRREDGLAALLVVCWVKIASRYMPPTPP